MAKILIDEAVVTIADELEIHGAYKPLVRMNAAAELRRLHAENQALRQALDQPAREPLTVEQIKGIYEDCDVPTGGEFTIAFTRAIEAAHGITEGGAA